MFVINYYLLESQHFPMFVGYFSMIPLFSITLLYFNELDLFEIELCS